MSLGVSCLRCGRCCFILVGGKLSNIPCKHLVRLKSGKSLCRIYSSRLGADCGGGCRCMLRVNVHRNFLGCPNNRPEWGVVDE